MPSSVGVDGGESLQAAGDVRGKRRLADVLKALQFTNQNPVAKKRVRVLSNCTEMQHFYYNNSYDIVKVV